VDDVTSWTDNLEIRWPAESNLGEHVVELGSTFSIDGDIVERVRDTGAVDGAVVHVDTVLVEAEPESVGHGEETVTPVDLIVGVTVADGLVKAGGLFDLSTKGFIGIVPGAAEVPALDGRGSGRVGGVAFEASESVGGCGGALGTVENGLVGVVVILVWRGD